MCFKPLLFTLEFGFSTPFSRIEYGEKKQLIIIEMIGI